MFLNISKNIYRGLFVLPTHTIKVRLGKIRKNEAQKYFQPNSKYHIPGNEDQMKSNDKLQDPDNFELQRIRRAIWSNSHL